MVIDNRQFIVLLFVSRIFTILTFVPQHSAVNGSIVLISLLLSAVIQVLLLIPIYFYLKRHPMDIIDYASSKNKIVGIIIAIFFFVFTIAVTANTVSHFQFFLTSAIYPQSNSLIFILIFITVICYSAYMGIEAFTRFAGFIFVFALISSIVVGISLYENYDLLNLINPFHKGIAPIFSGSISGIVNNTELVILLLLAPMVKKNVIKSAIWWLLISLIAFECITFGTLTVLGEFASTQLFPVYSLSSISEMSIFKRLDLLHMTLWFFIAFIRASLYIFLAAHSLKKIIPTKYAIIICGIVATALSILFSYRLEFMEMISKIISSGVFMILGAVVIPLIFLPKEKKT